MRRGMIITGFWTLKFVWHVARIDFIALLLMQLHELFNMAVNVRFACLLYGVFVVVCLVRMAAAAVRTFLQFRCNHWRTTSKPCNDSGDWKKSTLGPPSFFGPNDAILTNLSLECTEKFCNLCYTPLKQTNTDASVFFFVGRLRLLYDTIGIENGRHMSVSIGNMAVWCRCWCRAQWMRFMTIDWIYWHRFNFQWI